MLKWRYIQLFLFTCVVQLLVAQSDPEPYYNAVVLDAESLKPIPNAHALVINSTALTNTDQNGVFLFLKNDIAGKDLLLTHVSYEPSTHFVDLEVPDTDTIYLNLKSVTIEDVVVSSKRSNLKKDRLKVFTKDVFGSRRKSKHIQIENPNDIFLEERSDSLLAYGHDLIVVENKYLSYKIRFLLQDYLHSDEDIKYSGKVVYEDLNDGNSKVLKRREAYWEESQQVFFQSLLLNNFLERGFKCAIYDGVQEDFVPLVNVNKSIYKTTIPNIYALLVPNLLRISLEDKVSYIECKNGLLLFNGSGEIVNQKDVRVLGHWGSITLTQSLPTNFKPRIENPKLRFEKSYPIGTLKLLATQAKKPESIVQQLQSIRIIADNSDYSSEDNLFMAMHLFDKKTNSLVKGNELIHIEIFDLYSKKIVLKKIVQSIDGVASLGLPLYEDFYPGRFGVVAFTQYMNAYPKANFGTHQFSVDLKTDLISSDVYIKWFPEGQNLVEGVSNRVVFTVEDLAGSPKNLDSYLIDSCTGNQIALKTLMPGIGFVNIKPDCEFDYRIDPSLKEWNKLTSLKGASVFVSNAQAGHIGIQLNTTKTNNTYYKCSLLAMGSEFYSIDTLRVGQQYKISREYLPNSMIELQLKDIKGRIISQRFISNRPDLEEHVDAKTNYAFYYPNQSATISIDLDSTELFGLDDLAWTASVKKKRSTTTSNPTTKLVEDNNEVALKFLNSLRDFIVEPERTLVDSSSQEVMGIHEKTLSLSGWILAKGKNNGVSATVNVSSMKEDFYFDQIETDTSGRFSFEYLPFSESAAFIIQARDNKDGTVSFTDADRNVDIVLDTLSSNTDLFKMPQFSKTFSLLSDSMVVDTKELKFEDVNLEAEFDELTISARRRIRQNQNLVSLADKDFVRKEATMDNLLNRFFSRKDIIENPDDPTGFLIRHRRIDSYEIMGIIIDDLPYSNKLVLERYQAQDLSHFGFDGNDLVIYTNPEIRRKRLQEEQSKGILAFSFAPWTATLDVNDTESEQLKLSNETLYWNPKFKLSKSETTEIIFNTGDEKGEYMLSLYAHHPDMGLIELNKSFEVVDPQ